MSELPWVSVVMPVRNEAAHIRASLGAVLAQDYPRDRFEVLVADGRSDDGTRATIQAMAAEHPNLFLVDNPGRVVAPGLNSALRQARGEIIVRVDGHCEIAPDYLRRAVETLQNHRSDGVGCVGGPIETIGREPVSQAIAVAMSSPFGVGGSAFRMADAESHGARIVDTVAFPGWTREALERVGLFDEELVRNQDDEHNYRLRKAGIKVMLDPALASRYYSRSSLRHLLRQYFQYGFWKVRVLQKHPRQMKARQFAPPLLAAALLAGLLASPFSAVGRWFLAGTMASYLFANLLASLLTAARRGWRHLPVLPAAFVALHLGYGSGFLLGLLRFLGRWGDRRGQVPAEGLPPIPAREDAAS